ncbi:MAG: hypothetical protein B7C24_15850 [Bacteroidetes bacterium 4572_77]|nr:MAG: hypothetical protein B7C24_15850 [Bacteroidetes bacterium 4572_77]
MNWDLDHANKKNKALVINFLIIFWSWVPFVFISIWSNSITLIAQMLMGGAQSLSVYLSLLTTKKSVKRQKHLINREVFNARLMVLVFFLSFSVIAFIAIKRMFQPKDIELYPAVLGALVNAAAVFVNLYQWRKNLKVSKEEFSPLMESQWSLFRIKTFTALTSVLSIIVYYLPLPHLIHKFVDPVFSLALAALILFSAISLLRKAHLKGA